MHRVVAIVALAGACGCMDADADDPGDPDADVAPAPDAEVASIDAAPAIDAVASPPSLSELRDRLFADLAEGDPCASWNALDASQRAVFATLTHRLYISTTPDGLSMLDHMTALYLVLGGGASGTDCGGSENNRLFLSMDDYLWDLMVGTWNGTPTIGDGLDTHWQHTADLAGPHDPFDASNETEAGLECLLLVELPESIPPTAQAHFFQLGSEVPVQRGAGIDLPSDPYMLELDHDFDCLHQSNPLCPGRGFDDRYREHYGDFECDWVPLACTPDGDGCYRDAM